MVGNLSSRQIMNASPGQSPVERDASLIGNGKSFYGSA
jgi:hypothetical protein